MLQAKKSNDEDKSRAGQKGRRFPRNRSAEGEKRKSEWGGGRPISQFSFSSPRRKKKLFPQ